MNRLEQRLEQLETRNGGGDAYVIVDTRELSDEDAQTAIAQAERQVGKNGQVIVLQYTKTWPPN
jgi:hypothetical protein